MIFFIYLFFYNQFGWAVILGSAWHIWMEAVGYKGRCVRVRMCVRASERARERERERERERAMRLLCRRSVRTPNGTGTIGGAAGLVTLPCAEIFSGWVYLPNLRLSCYSLLILRNIASAADVCICIQNSETEIVWSHTLFCVLAVRIEIGNFSIKSACLSCPVWVSRA